MPAFKVVGLARVGRGRVSSARACASALVLLALLWRLAAPGHTAPAPARLAAQALPAISISDSSIFESEDPFVRLQFFNLRLSAPSAQPVTVSYATADGTATAGSDYEAASGILTFNPGVTSHGIPIRVVSDRAAEPDETFFVKLSAPSNATLEREQAVGTILNDDSPAGSLRLRGGSFFVSEGSSFEVSVARVNGSAGPVAVTYDATVGNRATPGLDFTPASGQLSFADGETQKSFQVQALADGVEDPGESIIVTLSNPTGGAALGEFNQIEVHITDVPPKASLGDATVVEGDAGTTAAVFTVSLSSPSAEAETVQYTTFDTGASAGQYRHRATPGSDYTAASGALTFAPGETTKTVAVQVAGDTEPEVVELFGLMISSTTIGITDSQGVGTIMNDDGPPLIGTGSAVAAEDCAPANAAPDPGEAVTVSFCLRNVGPAATNNLVATLAAGGGVTSPGDPQTFGAMAVGGAPACRAFAFTVDPNLAPGQPITAALQLQDGANALPPVAFQIALSRRVALRENFDGGLPQGWLTPSIGETGESQWFLTSRAFDTFPHSVAGSTTAGSPRELISPVFTVGTAQATLTFRHSFDLAEGTDGTFLDISLDGGQTYKDIVAAGGSFVAGGYTGASSTLNRRAWNGNSGGFVTTAISLPAAAAGQGLRLRWSIFSGNSTGRAGHFIDSILVADSPQPCGAPPAPALLTEEGGERAMSLDSVTLRSGPFPVKTWHNFSADGRTRVALYARNVELRPGEDAAAVMAAQAEDSRGAAHPLAVEYAGPLPGVEGVIQVNVVLPDALSAGGDFRVSLKLRGQSSNKVLVSIRPGASP
jgi:hypothetical protein